MAPSCGNVRRLHEESFSLIFFFFFKSLGSVNYYMIPSTMTRLIQEQLVLRDTTRTPHLICPRRLLCCSNTGLTFVEPVIPGSGSRDTLMCQGVLSQPHTHTETDRLEGHAHTNAHTHANSRVQGRHLLPPVKNNS